MTMDDIMSEHKSIRELIVRLPSESPVYSIRSLQNSIGQHLLKIMQSFLGKILKLCGHGFCFLKCFYLSCSSLSCVRAQFNPFAPRDRYWLRFGTLPANRFFRGLACLLLLTILHSACTFIASTSQGTSLLN